MMRLRSLLYAVIIVGVSVMILSTAIGIQP